VSPVESLPLLARRLDLRCDLSAVRDACRQARDFFSAAGLVEAEVDAWELVLAEAANNAVNYTEGAAKELPIRVDLLVAGTWVEVRVTDHSPGFDWPDQAELPLPDTESGRGLFLIQSLTDQARYLRSHRENCLVLGKHHLAIRQSPLALATEGAAPSEELRDVQRTLDLMTEELASSYESLSAIFRFSAELQDGVIAGDFVERWMRQLLSITESDWFVLRLSQRAPGHLRVAAASAPDWHGETLKLGEASTEENWAEIRAATQRNDVWFDALTPLSPQDPLSSLVQQGCGFTHPLFAGDTLVGVLSIGRLHVDRPFEAGQVNVVQTFGDFLGLQLRHTQMQEEQIRTRLNTRDLEIAANIQRSLLPEHLPTVSDFTLSGFYRSAREIGGDYYDALVTPEGHLLLVVADVMGKGLPAALFAFMFRSLVRARRDLASRPGEFLAWLNQNLFRELDRAEMFITAQIAYLDCERGEFRVASAGHPPMLLASPTGEVRELSADGPPLGIVAGAAYLDAVQAFSQGRALMFTDGLIEARNPRGELLGLEAVKSALANPTGGNESGEATRQALGRLLEEHEGGTAASDDIAFILISKP